MVTKLGHPVSESSTRSQKIMPPIGPENKNQKLAAHRIQSGVVLTGNLQS